MDKIKIPQYKIMEIIVAYHYKKYIVVANNKKLRSILCFSRWILPHNKLSTNFHFQCSPLNQERYIRKSVTISQHLKTSIRRNKILLTLDTEYYCSQVPTNSSPSHL